MPAGFESDFQRIYMAMAQYDARPLAGTSGVQGPAPQPWGLAQLDAYPGGAIAFAVDQVHRDGLLRLLLDSRQKRVLDNAQFDAILSEITTAAGRVRVLAALRELLDAREATQDLIGRVAGHAVSAAGRHVATQQEQEDFLRRAPNGPGALYREFMARKDVQRELLPLGRSGQVYEFSWGFITEEYGVWNFYVAEVWRAGTTGYYDEFVAAWNALVEPALQDAMARSGGQFYISFDEGSSVYGCISLSCVLGTKGQRLAREWVVHEFIGKLWPMVLQRVLEPQHATAYIEST